MLILSFIESTLIPSFIELAIELVIKSHLLHPFWQITRKVLVEGGLKVTAHLSVKLVFT